MAVEPTIAALSQTAGTLVQAQANQDLCALSTSTLRQLFVDSGAVLLRGFHVDAASFRHIATSIGGTFVSHGAPHRPNVLGDETLHLADGGTHAINLHIELGYLPNPPDAIWFRCVVPPEVSGSTIACDGAAIFSELSARARDILSEKKLKYLCCWPAFVWSRYFQSANTDAVRRYLSTIPSAKFQFHDERLILEYSAPALLSETRARGRVAFANSLLHYVLDGYGNFVRFHDDEPIPPWLCKEIKEVSDRLAVDIAWRADDLLLLDNRRVLHGRRAHTDIKRQLQVRMLRLDADPQ